MSVMSTMSHMPVHPNWESHGRLSYSHGGTHEKAKDRRRDREIAVFDCFRRTLDPVRCRLKNRAGRPDVFLAPILALLVPSPHHLAGLSI